MATNIDLSGESQAGDFAFSLNTTPTPSTVRLSYRIGAGGQVVIDDVGDVIGTNFDDTVEFQLGLNDTFHLSSFRGGAGRDTVTVSGRGTYNLAGVSEVENFVFGASVVMPDSVFGGVAGGVITASLFASSIFSPTSLDASALTADHSLILTVNLTSFIPITAGAGDDVFVGNLLNGAGEVIHGGLGRDNVYITTTDTLGQAILGQIDGVEFFQLGSDVVNNTNIRSQNFVGVTGGQIGVAVGALGGTLNASTLATTESVWLIGSASTDTFTGGAAADVFHFRTGDISSADTVVGGGGSDVILVNGAGAMNVSGVSGVEFYYVAGGGSVVISDANFADVSGFLGAVASNGGGVDASAVTASHAVFLIGSSGADIFAGGAGADVFMFGASDLSGADEIVGGGGVDLLLLNSTGAIDASGVSGIDFYQLASGSANNLVLTDANLSGLALFGVSAGSSGDTLDASAVTLTGLQVFLFGGVGNDILRGGDENDVLSSNGGADEMTGGGGADGFSLSSTGITTITDFSALDLLILRDDTFDLGASEGGGSDFDRLDASAFSVETDGSFTDADQRFSFDAATHQLFYAAQGSLTDPGDIHVVAVLTGVTSLSAGDLFYTGGG